jgi:pimeloyl-ACP methyl ester carboxylesterase
MANGVATTRGSATEIYMRVESLLAKHDGTRPGIVYCHSVGNDSAQVAATGYVDTVTMALAQAGYMLYGGDMGGTAVWGNDASQTAVTTARTNVQAAATGGAKAGKVGLLATSMGALTALNWARANPSLVACIGLMIPVVDLAYEHDNNVNGYAAAIEAAYTNLAGYQAAVATHDPMQNTASHASGPPIKMWRSTDDAIAVTARQDAFAAAVGSNCQVSSLGAAGHFPQTVPPTEVVAFFQANL